MEKRTKSVVNETYYFEQLPNGLQVYLIPNEKIKSFYITFSTKFGSTITDFKHKNETDYHHVPNGVAHFLEHQMFTRKNGSSVSLLFDKYGSSTNAFTSYSVTCYEVFGTRNFKDNLELLIDYVQEPAFNKKSVNKEKGIITEETKSYHNNPNHEISMGINKLLFSKYHERNIVTGEIEDIDAITEQDLKLCYDYFYHPANMFITISGNFNVHEAISIIKENQSKKKFKKYQEVIIKKEKEPVAVTCKYAEKEMNVEIPKLNINYKLNKKLFKSLKINDIELISYLKMIMRSSIGSVSEFYQYLLDNKLVISWSVISRKVNDYYILGISTKTPYSEEIIGLVREQFKKLKITEEEFERKRKLLLSSYIVMFDDIEATNIEIQEDLISYNKCIDNYYDIIKSLNYDNALKIIKIIEDNLQHEVIYKIIPFN